MMQATGRRQVSRRTVLVGAGGIFGAAALAGCVGSGAVTYSGSVKPTVQAYVPYWDQADGFQSANAHRELFDGLSTMWYSLNSSGEVILADEVHTRVDLRQVRSFQAAGVRVLPTFTSLRDGEWQPNAVSEMLSDATSRARHRDAIVDLVLRDSYDGADIDYEGLRAEDRENYSVFLADLGSALRSKGKLLASSVYAKESEPGPNAFNEAQDFEAIGKACDQVRLMAYDFHYAGSDPGPGAPVAQVAKGLDFIVTTMDPETVALGIVLLGYDWPDGDSGGTVTYQQAMKLARKHGATVERDSDSTPHFSYEDDDGKGHEVWFEDAESSARKLALVDDYGIGSIFFWRLGGEDPETWEKLSRALSC